MTGDIDERSRRQMGDEIPFDVNVIGKREDYNFLYMCVKKMVVWSFFGLVPTLGLPQVLTSSGFLAWY